MAFHLTEVEKDKLVALKEEGNSNKICALKIGRTERTVRKWWRRYEEEGQAGLLKRKPPGCPRKTTAQEDFAIAAVAEKQPLQSLEEVGKAAAAALDQPDRTIPKHTVRRRLREHGVNTAANAQQKKRRLASARRMAGRDAALRRDNLPEATPSVQVKVEQEDKDEAGINHHTEEDDPLRLTLGDLITDLKEEIAHADAATPSSSGFEKLDRLSTAPDDPEMQIEIKEEVVSATNPSSSAGGGSMLRCFYCNHMSLSQDQLDGHVKRRHGHIGRDGKHKCEWCSYSSDNACTLVSHLRTHTGERPYRCAECGKAFSSLGGMTLHRRIHTGQRPYICDVCGKTFIGSVPLNVHRRIHTGEKVRQCEQCGASFKDASHYNTHMKSHNGVKVHGCQVCSARFVRRSELTAHMRTHTGERPYVCSFCPARFMQRAHRGEHVIRLHTHDYKHRCDRCGKGFVEPCRLKKHVEKCFVAN